MSGTQIYSLPEEEELKSLCFFPSLPRVRIRRHYEADTERKATICTKKSYGHTSLSPGVFTIFCPHGLLYSLCTNNMVASQSCFLTGICYGFQAMRFHESPNIPFQLSMRGFIKVTKHNNKTFTHPVVFFPAPDTIVYDIGCNLHNYCLNREPQFFKFARFYVDKFHWRNHTGKSQSCIHTIHTITDCIKYFHRMQLGIQSCYISYTGINEQPSCRTVKCSPEKN